MVEVGLSLLSFVFLALAGAASAQPVAEAPALDVKDIVTNVRLTAERIEYSYRKQDASGAFLPAVLGCWNLTTGAFTNGACP